MSGSTTTQKERVDWSPDNRGSFSRMTVMMERKKETEDWECPFCSHSIRYGPGDADVAQMAADSHLLRRHRSEVLGHLRP